MSVKTYDELESSAARAQQLWLVLISLADHTETITYEDLTSKLGLKQGGAHIL